MIIEAIALQHTEHGDSSVARQSAAYGPGFAAVHLSIVHLHVVDPQGPVRKQLKTRVLEGRMKGDGGDERALRASST